MADPRLPGPIVLAVDDSDDAAVAASAACDVALHTGAPLHLVHALSEPVEEFGTVVETLMVYRERRGARVLEDATADLRERGCDVAETHLRTGSPVDEVLDVADRISAALVVVGSRGRGRARRVTLGSVSQGVVHHSRHPVLVLRGSTSWPPSRIVLGDDASGDARHAGSLAVTFAQVLGAHVLVVRALPDLADLISGGPYVGDAEVARLLRDAELGLEKRTTAIAASLGERPSARVVVDEPAVALLDTSEEGAHPALIVVGSRGLGRVQRMRLGSVSTQVVRGASGAVLVVPGPPAES